MIDFDIKDGRLILKPEHLTVPVFREIYERDKAKNKETALKELLYIYHMASTKSPYADMDFAIKEGHIKKKIFGKDKYEVDDTVKSGVEEYLECSIDAVDRILYDFNKKIDEVRRFVMDASVTDGNIDKIMNRLKELDKILEAKEKIDARVSSMKNVKVKGDLKMGFQERRSMKNGTT